MASIRRRRSRRRAPIVIDERALNDRREAHLRVASHWHARAISMKDNVRAEKYRAFADRHDQIAFELTKNSTRAKEAHNPLTRSFSA